MLAAALGGVLLIALIAGISAMFSLLSRNRREFALPDAQDASALRTEGAGNEAQSEIQRVRVTTDNVRDVIGSLLRPESYSRDIMIESFWEGGNAVRNISVAVMGGVSSMRSMSGDGVKNIIVTSDKLYIWYNGDAAPYEGPRYSSGDARRTADEYQMLMTYEDISDLDDADVTDAGYVEYGGSRCIFVEFRAGAFGYITRCYISPELGLIMGAEEYDGDALIYKMTTGVCSIGEQDESAFILPDGSSALPSFSPE
jgi:hypothetical protein